MLGSVCDHGSSPRGRGTRYDDAHQPSRGRFIPARAGNTVRGNSPLSPRTVHPRAGGEHALADAELIQPFGSSPRGRGTRNESGYPRFQRRFIPARAGNTSTTSSGFKITAVHPRAGGEHSTAMTAVTPATGSSPRGRGTRHGVAVGPRRGRFIPARAGNTTRPPAPRRRIPVHPRAGGEHVLPHEVPTGIVGSSPRGRGTQIMGWFRDAHDRFIPARAGNTGRASAASPYVPVHPRAGGEHFHALFTSINRAGSSPRGRGTPGGRGRHRMGMRFIPARAGNTGRSTATATPSPVHPRAGGEHRPVENVGDVLYGSSPRGRGTPRVVPSRSSWVTVHPRAGGEHNNTFFRTTFSTGSSPRGRGTRRIPRDVRGGHRFIPARAGNTITASIKRLTVSVHPRAGGEHYQPVHL